MKRQTFLAGSIAAAGLAIPSGVRSAAPAPAGSAVNGDVLLGRLMAGNKRFVENDFPTTTRFAEKRALLTETQAPFAAILGCCDSRVIPELVFVQGIGELFVARIAGNFPDDAVIGSLEYAVEHLGTRLVMVLGHEGCGALKAVYAAIESNAPLPSHLSALQTLIAPGIRSVVEKRGGVSAAIEANVRAAVARLRAAPPVFASGVASGTVRLAGGIYELASGSVKLI